MQSKDELKVTSVIRECALRHNAERLFDAAEALEAQEIRIDFSGCDSLTRSFAQEYVRRKAASKKLIRESKLSEEAKRMLEIVQRPRKKERFDFSRWKEESFPSC
jgi:uncharacterized Rossmann fold enzyme